MYRLPSRVNSTVMTSPAFVLRIVRGGADRSCRPDCSGRARCRTWRLLRHSRQTTGMERSSARGDLLSVRRVDSRMLAGISLHEENSSRWGLANRLRVPLDSRLRAWLRSGSPSPRHRSRRPLTRPFRSPSQRSRRPAGSGRGPSACPRAGSPVIGSRLCRAGRHGASSTRRSWSSPRRRRDTAVVTIVGTERPAPNGREIVAVVFDADGSRLGDQVKTQIDPSEDAAYVAGSGRRVFTAAGMTFGIAICHEAFRYPEIARSLVLAGAQVVFVPHFVTTTDGSLPARWCDADNPYNEKSLLSRAARKHRLHRPGECRRPGPGFDHRDHRARWQPGCESRLRSPGVAFADIDLGSCHSPDGASLGQRAQHIDGSPGPGARLTDAGSRAVRGPGPYRLGQVP